MATRPSRTEPMLWSLFMAGGGIAAFLFPVHIVILGIALGAGWLGDALSYDRIFDLVRNPLIKIYLGAVVALPLYHAAHRIRFTLHHEIGIHGGKRLVAAACYGSAIAGTGLTVWALLRI
jgi:succinate dehydrogenase subunit D